MKEIISLKKELAFNTYIEEITSISIDKKVNTIINNEISGVFDLYLEYKENDISINTISYDNKIPFTITLDNKYNLDNITVDIDDFYYEINDKKVILNIDVLVSNLLFKEIDDKSLFKESNERELFESEDLFKEEDTSVKLDLPIFETFNVEKETFVTYKVHIVKEDETKESICKMYEITNNELEDYNNVKDIKLGDKLIIPTYKK